MTPEELSLLVGIGNLIGTAVDNARLFEQVRAGRNRLQALSRRLVEVQETERRHIARELHDEVGQALTGLKLTLDMSQRLPPNAVGMRERANLLGGRLIVESTPGAGTLLAAELPLGDPLDRRQSTRSI